MRKLSEIHKQHISASCKGKTKNNGKIWITNGYIITRISPNDLIDWQKKGFTQGKKLIDRPQIAWNKGLKAIQDPRVAKQARKKKIN